MSQETKELEVLKAIVKQKGLKYTKQREIIYQSILDSDEHLNADELYSLITIKYPDEKIGIATVYRALSFLEEVDLISSIDISSNEGKKFESNIKEHHDHLICVKCGKIVEFVNDKIEQEQEKVAQKNGFKLLRHSMYLYGICPDCE